MTTDLGWGGVTTKQGVPVATRHSKRQAVDSPSEPTL